MNAQKNVGEDAPEIGDITRLSPEETRAYFPLLSEESYEAVHVSGAARVNGRALRDALLRASGKRGAVMVHGDASLTFEGDTVTGVEVDGQKLQADEVIVTAGAWAKPLFQPLGIQFLSRPQKAQIVHLDVEGAETADWPGHYAAEQSIYAVFRWRAHDYWSYARNGRRV